MRPRRERGPIARPSAGARGVHLRLGIVRLDLQREVEPAGAGELGQQMVEHRQAGRDVRGPGAVGDARTAHSSARSIDAPSAAQPLVDALVPAVDLPDVPDRRRALGAERGDHHRHAGADVRALEPLAVQPRRAGDDGAMRVAEDDSRAHRDELVDEEQAALEHLLEDQDGARAPASRR